MLNIDIVLDESLVPCYTIYSNKKEPGMKINIVNTPAIEIVADENLRVFFVNKNVVEVDKMSMTLADLVQHRGLSEKIIYDFNDGMVNNGQGIGSLVCNENADRITAGAFKIIDG